MRAVRSVSHVHSEWSYDAIWPMPKIAAAFRRRRCSVILSTEHDRGFTEQRLAAYRTACAAASSDQFVVVPGIEYSDVSNATHVLVWGDVPFLGEGMPTGRLLEEVAAHHGLAVLAHPWRNDAWQRFDPTWTSHLFGIELWNRKSDGWSPEPRAASVARSEGLVGFASLDFHRARQFFPLGMRLLIEGELSEQSVLQALRTGNCSPTALGFRAERFTSGPALQVATGADWTRRLVLRYLRRAKYATRSYCNRG